MWRSNDPHGQEMTSWVVASKVYTPKVNELIDLLEYKKLKNLGKMANKVSYIP